jgi:hypothetical protein
MNYGSVAESIYNYRVENGRTYHAVRFGFSNLLNDTIGTLTNDILLL